MFHVGGQNVYYNVCIPLCAGCTKHNVNRQQPFPPPGSLQWTIGRMYYVSLITAKIFGPSNASQIVDLSPNANNIYTLDYTIYENGNPTRLALLISSQTQLQRDFCHRR